MSDHIIRVIPEDPRHLPNARARAAAKAYMFDLAPDADEIEDIVEASPVFIDCGENFESVSCPTCKGIIAEAVWLS
jgi:hypothetical protein